MEKILYIVPILLFSVVVHEYAHGYVAYRWGDPTAAVLGRLTLTPVPHIDPIGSLLVPALMAMTGGFLFGWAKPVPVNPDNYRDKKLGDITVVNDGQIDARMPSYDSAAAYTVRVRVGGVSSNDATWTETSAFDEAEATNDDPGTPTALTFPFTFDGAFEGEPEEDDFFTFTISSAATLLIDMSFLPAGKDLDMPAGIKFTETMRGFFSTKETDDFKLADEAGRRDKTRLEFTVTIVADDVDKLVSDPAHQGRITGTVTCAALSPQPMAAEGEEGPNRARGPDQARDLALLRAVVQRHDIAVRRQPRSERGQRLLGVAGLHREEDGVERPAHLLRQQDLRADGRLDEPGEAEAVRAHRLHMRAVHLDEAHAMPRARELDAGDRADRAGADDGEFRHGGATAGCR